MKRYLLFLFSHRTLANFRWDFHLLRVRLVGFLSNRFARARRDVRSRPHPRYLNLGSGPRGLDSPQWINIDAFPDRNVQYLFDFNRALPFEEASFDGVFCEHVLEHFSFDDGVALMTGIGRNLKPGGVLRVIVPDAAWLVRTYFEDPAALVAHRGVKDLTPMEVVNDYFRQRYEHHFFHDFDSMRKLLNLAGFDEVIRSTFGQSAMSADLVLDDVKYAPESLYVEARKS